MVAVRDIERGKISVAKLIKSQTEAFKEEKKSEARFCSVSLKPVTKYCHRKTFD